ncbi:uncharacterized protein lrif1 isoform X1 [Hippocampus zosterae]|uniref:uncharacterized protein lrif1 isoform X1 n=1 Tax=Hippocampus zosterae TaxID=109293 RepID=UPI00223CCDBF|nr:uncharacterized protein lrif1 isoform X1 [Hippocampus zosterae]
MYSAPQQDNVAQRGTGVFYQALPAIGADGRNIMALIPVQIVNGKCVQTQVIKHKTLENVSAPVPFGIKTAVTSLAMKQTPGNQISLANGLPCQLGVADQALEFGITLNTCPLRTEEPKTFLRAPKSQVRSVSASEVHAGIKKQLLLSSSSSFSSSDLTIVPTVSSKTTVCQSNVSSYVSELSLGSPKSHLKLIPKVSQRPDSPMKWVIEEINSNESAVDLSPSPSIPSKTFQTMKRSNKFGVLEQVAPVSPPGLTTSETHQQQALVMCDGRMFFAAKKGAPSSPMESKEKSWQLKNPVVPASSFSLLQHSSIITSKVPNEVIDLCTDDHPDDLSQTLQSGTCLDEDNVIFVSYIPPKSENVPIERLVDKTLEKETRTRTLDQDTEHKRTTFTCSDTTHDQLTCESSIGRSQKPDQSQTGSSNALPVCRSSDHLLRQMFGVTADVRIRLRRINLGSSGLGLNEPALKCPREDIQETTNLLKESDLFMQYRYNLKDRCSRPLDVRRTKLSGDIVASSPPAGVMVGYVEPIDDDIPNSDENDTPEAQDSAAQNMNGAHSNTSRLGRARKRTMCSCCVPGTLGLPTKTSTGVEESQRLTWTRDHTSKRNRRWPKVK